MLKKIITISLFFTVLSLTSWTQAQNSIPEIIAVVNHLPITKDQFIDRKNMVVTLNKIGLSSQNEHDRLNANLINAMIDEQIIIQHAEKAGTKITNEDIETAIATIASSNKITVPELENNIKNQGVKFSVFKQQIKGEIAKNRIMSAIANQVSVSEQEFDTAFTLAAAEQIHIDAWLFNSGNITKNQLKEFTKFKKSLKTCQDITENKKYPYSKKFLHKQDPKTLNPNLQSVINDTLPGSATSIVKNDQNQEYQFALICKKSTAIEVPEANKEQLRYALSNIKMSKKAEKLFRDLRNKAAIYIYWPPQLKTN